VRVSDLTRERPVTVTVAIEEGEQITLVFDRNRITPAWFEQASRRATENDALSLPKALAEVMLNWDVYQEAEGDFPPTAENIAVLPMVAQNELLMQIVEAAAPSRAEGNASANTSVTPAPVSTSSPVTHQNGQPLSPSPAPSAVPSPT
jgi:hypothetical protein